MFVAALLLPLLENAASSANLDRKLLTTGVPHKLAGALLYVPALGIISTLAHLTHLVVQDDSYSVLHCCAPCPLQTFL